MSGDSRPCLRVVRLQDQNDLQLGARIVEPAQLRNKILDDCAFPVERDKDGVCRQPAVETWF